MAVVSFEYYKNEYLGEAIAGESFPRLELRAEDFVLGLIGKTADEVAALPAVTQAAIKKAICAQIEYLYEYGTGIAVYGKEAGGGFTVGKVSVNNGGSMVAAGAKSMVAPAVYSYLERTGLLNPSVGTAPEPWLWGWFGC